MEMEDCTGTVNEEERNAEKKGQGRERNIRRVLPILLPMIETDEALK